MQRPGGPLGPGRGFPGRGAGAFQHTRTRLLKRLESVPIADRDPPFTIRNRSLTLTDYLKGLADHEEHHRKQNDAFLRTCDGSWNGPATE